MKNKFCKLFIIFFILNINFLYSQTIEKLAVMNEMRLAPVKIAGIGSFPEGLYFDEIESLLITQDPTEDYIVTINIENNNITREKKSIPYVPFLLKFGNDFWGYNDHILHPIIKNLSCSCINIQSGISFILKKDKEYIVYYVDEDGYPGAVDTSGRIYSSEEAMEYLKEHDPEKYKQSEKRAAELELYNDFIRNRVLIWGSTYYTTTYIIEKFYGKNDPYIKNGEIQYDNSGYGYQIYFTYKNFPSNVCIVNPDGTRNAKFSIRDYSTILSTYEDGENRKYFRTSYFIGFGGNIYYYIAGEEYTEVFRIRRTWGEPDFYAMAINGYTEDEYGKYVDKVLPALSKEDLRLLRNTVFALYGVHFKSEDLAKHFDKQVWYTDEGKTSADVALPEHRQKLVEMIQKLES